MPAALRVAARDADRRALAADDGEPGGVRGGVRLAALDAGAEGNGRAGVVRGAGVVGDADGLEVVRPQGEGAGAGGLAEVAGRRRGLSVLLEVVF